MSPPTKSIRNANGGQAMDDSETASNNLWVGNLSPDVTESDLTSLFSKYGVVDSITAYASRCYAFVYFKRVQDAKAALEALNGAYLQGNSLKIEFAKPAKPCKSLWVSGISPSIKKEVLEEEFLKFGKIEEFKFLRERNTAYIDYSRLEDASLALKNMNGKRIGGDQIRVDFLRSHSIRREPWADYRDSRDGPKHSQSSGGRKGDGQPSNILWVGYPPSVHIDEQMLHNAMILFGEIERIRSFPSRNYSFVEFRSVDEARLAKEGLQGRLFNDPRITIMYSSSGQTPSKDYPGFYPGVMGPRPDALFDEPPFHPAHVDMFNHTRPMVPNSLSRPTPSSGILGPNMLMRPLGPQGSFEPLLSGPEFNDLTAINKVLDADPNSLVGGPSWRRSSPAPAIFPSPSQGGKRPTKPLSSGAWDVFDANQLERESKRSRIDSVLPGYDPDFPSRKMDIRGSGLDQLYGLAPRVDRIPSGQLSNVQEKNIFGPPEIRITPRGTGQGYADHDYIWRGVIAKGGTPVCRARCVPVGEGIESEIPEMVNCSARTGLDMLTKHYADAIGFDVVFFLPDSEEDFASYTEFLRYLGAKDRAGVAKFDDATTLFLVPPSDFLYKVLKVVGPERLYGVVLKFPQHDPSSPSVPPQSFQSQYLAGHQMPSLNVYSGMHQKEEKVLQMDYSRVFHEDSLPPTKQLAHSTTNSIPMQLGSVNTSAESQAGIKLTPELIATLASLLPASAKSSISKVAEPSVGSSSMKPSLPPPELDRGLLPRVWTHDVQGIDQTGHTVHQLENQYNPQRQQLSQHQAYPTGVSTSSDFAMGLTVQSQVQDPAFQLSQQGTVSSRPLSNFGVPSQSGQMAVPHAVNQQHQYEVPQNTQEGFGVAHGTDSLGSYGSSIYQQSANSVMFPNQVRGSDVTHPHMAMPPAADKGNSELPNQVQQVQSAPYGASQGTSEVEVDKNQRYQSTLQFAANLLLQLQQQQQQQTGTHGGQGSANH